MWKYGMKQGDGKESGGEGVFDAWLDDKEAEQIILSTWAETVTAGPRKDCNFMAKLKKTKAALKLWSDKKFGQLDNDIDNFKNIAQSLEIKAESSSLSEQDLADWKEARKCWFDKEKIKTSMMKQKARVRWILEGDENSKYFHSVIRNNYNRNNIRGLNIDGVWNDNPLDIKQATLNHFSKNFDEPNISIPSLEDLHYPSITQIEAAELENSFPESEIFEVINDCGSIKAPGPDGFNFRFFKKYWNTIKRNLLEAITWFWEKGEFSKGCNASFITLVPKKSDPLCLGDFRPISLIGCYYKIVAKMLSSRLRKVLPNLVGCEQSAFLKGRFILDGALIANETVDFLKAKKTKGLIFKVDFEKAFDSLNWKFLLDVMKCMGFGVKWRSWISSCLKSASVSILVNGSPTHEFLLGRGVRQGDPLSPFLYILAAEGLNILTKAGLERNLFKGIEVGKDKILVSHLQYADDTIFFGEWSHRNAFNLRNILKCFELASGLKVNFSKSYVYGVNVNQADINPVAQHLGCQVGHFPFIYLGIPIGSRMKKVSDWQPVIDKFEKRLSSWKMRSMSVGGRLILIKSVLSSLPLYYFSLFRAPQCVIKLLESVRRNFFWGGSGSQQYIAWIKWEGILNSYENGGLNIGSLKSKNLALLGKWWWRFKTETNAFWVKIIRSIYGVYGGLVTGSSTSLVPGTWTNIIMAGKAIELSQVEFSNCFRRSIHDGGSTSFWHDHWISIDKLSNLFPRLYRLESNADVTGDGPDRWVWTLDSDGLFRVKSLASSVDTRLLGSNGSSLCTIHNNIIPKKIEIFAWQTLKKRLPVHLELDKRGIDLDSVRCPLCDDDLESVEHSIIFCKHALDIWDRVYKWWNMGSFSSFSIQEVLGDDSASYTSKFGMKVWLAVRWISAYLIWKNRNNKVFRGSNWTVPVAFNEIQIRSFEWISTRSKDRKLDWLVWISNPSSYLSS
ncbi:uncharacterized protein [Rutidosis leptorrhynchoides]|uniref:uncharacterized protein n=1 Tax=Rutidosis leptorrhynchoides TaxID=125765 RepID=UPI003A9937FD